MNNKTLRRILVKTLDLRSRDDLVAALAEFESRVAEAEFKQKLNAFSVQLVECFDSLDKAISDLDRVIDIRDRSLSISSKEMIALNEQISAEASRQQAVLDQLRSTLRLLREGHESLEDDSENDLNKLVHTVDELVKSQLNSARDLKAIFEEGLRVAAAMTFSGLELQLQESATRITGCETKVKFYFSSHLFGGDQAGTFYACNEHNLPAERLEMNSGANFQTISSTKGAGILAFVRIDFASVKDSPKMLARIQPLLPNVAATLENIRLMHDERRKQRMESELQTARFVQQALLPPASPFIADGSIEISGFYQNASECGGDWWTYTQMADGRHIVLVGDVTGHGSGSAMICAVVKGYCDSFVDRRDLSLATMLKELNIIVFRVGREVGRAMTMAALSIDVIRGEVTFANAGHPHPILIKSPGGSDSRKTQYLINSGQMLGLRGAAEYEERKAAFHIGDQIVLYSDGLTEYISRNKDMYGDQRLRRFLMASKPNVTAAELNRALIMDVRDFALGEAPADDITTVVIKNIGIAARSVTDVAL